MFYNHTISCSGDITKARQNGLYVVPVIKSSNDRCSNICFQKGIAYSYPVDVMGREASGTVRPMLAELCASLPGSGVLCTVDIVLYQFSVYSSCDNQVNTPFPIATRHTGTKT